MLNQGREGGVFFDERLSNGDQVDDLGRTDLAKHDNKDQEHELQYDHGMKGSNFGTAAVASHLLRCLRR